MVAEVCSPSPLKPHLLPWAEILAEVGGHLRKFELTEEMGDGVCPLKPRGAFKAVAYGRRR